jgi:anaerobic selenocysteine-containing dehydrogenase
MLTLSSTPIASNYFQVRVGGDAATIKGICKALLAMDEDARASGRARVLDHTFIAEHTAGFDALVADIEATGWDEIERASGLRGGIESVAHVYAKAKATIVCYGMGITQHATGTENVQQLINLLLLKGNIGRPGAGICPLRGHSNVQGDRTVGIWEKPGKAMPIGWAKYSISTRRASTATRGGKHRGDARRSFQGARLPGRKLAIASSDPQASFEGLRKLDLSVHITTKLNRTHLLVGERTFVLPCLGRTDIDMQETGQQFVTVEDSMSMVHASRGFVKPPSDDVRSEPWIVAQIASATLRGKAGIGGTGLSPTMIGSERRSRRSFPNSMISTSEFASQAGSLFPTPRAIACGRPIAEKPISWSREASMKTRRAMTRWC